MSAAELATVVEGWATLTGLVSFHPFQTNAVCKHPWSSKCSNAISRN